jgi:DNA-binding beta-propeller fold protein YncE
MNYRTKGWIYILLASLMLACRANTSLPPSLIFRTTVTAAATIASTPTMASVATATSQSTSLPVEFAWKLAGDPNPFNAPVGVAIDPQGNIYVMDTKNSRVQKFDQDGKFLLMWGSPGNGDGQFSINLPDEGRLAIDSQGNVYVIDLSNFRIQKFDSHGNYLTQWGSRGDGDSQFLEPADIAIDKQDNIYVVDYQSYHVQKFDTDGKLLLRWGSAAQFANIGSVAIDPQGNVLVCDQSGRVRKFDSNGNLLSTIPPQSLNNTPIDTWNIAVDDQGNIYIADHGSYRIVKLDSQWKVLATWRSKETGAVMFDSLEDIAVDEQGNVYITDSASNLVQKFRQSAFRP